MIITHYLYNTFVIKADRHKIAIDPGGLFLYYFRLSTLIPKSEWPDLTHILITHGDPDHYWHADRVAKASGAAVVCNKSMVRSINGKPLMLGPRSKGVAFTSSIKNLHTLSVDETISVDGLTVRGLKATHGSLTIKIGLISKTFVPGSDERIGWGAIGFDIKFADKHIVNLGDTLLHTSQWRNIIEPDVLMIPIGGKEVHNTMDEDEALEAVSLMNPTAVIPCHYNCPGLFTNKLNPADVNYFKSEVEKLNIRCLIMGKGDSVEI